MQYKLNYLNLKHFHSTLKNNTLQPPVSKQKMTKI